MVTTAKWKDQVTERDIKAGCEGYLYKEVGYVSCGGWNSKNFETIRIFLVRINRYMETKGQEKSQRFNFLETKIERGKIISFPTTIFSSLRLCRRYEWIVFRIGMTDTWHSFRCPSLTPSGSALVSGFQYPRADTSRSSSVIFLDWLAPSPVSPATLPQDHPANCQQWKLYIIQQHLKTHVLRFLRLITFSLSYLYIGVRINLYRSYLVFMTRRIA